MLNLTMPIYFTTSPQDFKKLIFQQGACAPSSPPAYGWGWPWDMTKTRNRLENGLIYALEITSLKMLFCYRNTAEKNKTRNNNLKKNI